MIAPYMFVHNIRVSYIAAEIAFWLGLYVNRESPIHDFVAIQFSVYSLVSLCFINTESSV